MTIHNLNPPQRVTMDSLGVNGEGGEGQQLAPTSLGNAEPHPMHTHSPNPTLMPGTQTEVHAGYKGKVWDRALCPIRGAGPPGKPSRSHHHASPTSLKPKQQAGGLQNTAYFWLGA